MIKLRDRHQPSVQLKSNRPKASSKTLQTEGFSSQKVDQSWDDQKKLRSLARSESSGKSGKTKKKGGFWKRLLNQAGTVASAVAEGLTKALGIATAIVNLINAVQPLHA